MRRVRMSCYEDFYNLNSEASPLGTINIKNHDFFYVSKKVKE